VLCHRVDGWEQALYDLLGMLGSTGLKSGNAPVPVVVTGADTVLKEERSGWRGKAWVKCAPLGRFSAVDDEDVLAYQWWLLNPPAGRPVYAPRPGGTQRWRKVVRLAMPTWPRIYDEEQLLSWLAAIEDDFVSDTDDALLASYAQAQAGGGRR
jgi:hypothetical protein